MARNVSVERFKKLTEDLQNECVDIAHKELGNQAERLVNVMKSVCPVNADPPPQPGLLRNSIKWTFGTPPKTRATGAFRPNPKNTSDSIASVYAGDDKAFYARWVEFGTQAHSLSKGASAPKRGRASKGQSTGTQHPGSPAQPFFWPTYRLLKKSMRTTVKRRLTTAIKKRSAE